MSETAGRAGSTSTSVPGLLQQRWGSVLHPDRLPSRFAEPGWTYREPAPRPCPHCAGDLHTLHRPYELAGRQYHHVALACPSCPRVFSLADLGAKRYEQLLRPPAPSPAAAPEAGAPQGTSTRPRGDETKPRAPGRVPGSKKPGRPARPAGKAVGPAGLQGPAVWWGKVTDPAWQPPEQALRAAADARVILPAEERFDPLREKLAALGARVRTAAHWVETEHVATVTDRGEPTPLAVRLGTAHPPAEGPAAQAARDAFAVQWDALDELPDDTGAFTPVGDLVPQAWASLLPYPSFNPVQAATVPAVLDGDGHVMAVAPTGAGKTVIGMVAALAAHHAGRKAAWLVPQRSLTDELDRDLTPWRRAGLRIARLTGEAATDARLIHDADLWVATTEKFEAICRTGSLRAALAEVGCLVVDEIHLLGDPVRGPVLEALLARVREDADRVRIVGLSATVANADEVAEWLGARLIRSPWRPTRLTWQLPLLPDTPAAGEWGARDRARTAHAVALTRRHTAEAGSVLVFCGSKRAVRATALAIAHDRGTDTTGADPDDTDTVERLCTKAGVRLHYRDWPHKHDAEHAFRTRQADVLVATSTVAAGVNLPARAVIVRDTQIGIDPIEVSMVQQMFGRAGRIGAGEREGHAYLLTTPAERPAWQARLAAGYTVTSRIHDHLPDHLLAEAVQGRLATLTDAETWWTRTLAHHQGHRTLDLLHHATDFLHHAGHLTTVAAADGGPPRLHTTELGRLTSRFMVDADLATALAATVRRIPVPAAPRTAEDLLLTALATCLPALEHAPFSEHARQALTRILRTLLPDEDPAQGTAPADHARAVLLLAAHAPGAFRGNPSYIHGIPAASLTPVLDEAERYLAWLAAQGPLATVHPWTAITAADLAARIRWRTLNPTRGAGRLLRICEQMATPAHAADLVPALWRAARARGITSPDWPGTTPPDACRLTPADYRTLLAARTTGTTITLHPDHARIHAPRSAALVTWNGGATAPNTSSGEPIDLPYPPSRRQDRAAGRVGAAVFTRSDCCAAGWLAQYNAAE